MGEVDFVNGAVWIVSREVATAPQHEYTKEK